MKRGFTKALYAVFVCALSLVQIVQAADVHTIGTQANTSSIADPPIMLLNDRYYTFADMTGITRTDFLTQVQSQAIALTDAQLTHFIGQYWNASPTFGQPHLPKDITRAQLEKKYCSLAYLTALDQAALIWCPSAIVDNIVKDHQTNLNEYYDLDVLAASTRKENQFLTFLFQHRAEPTQKNDTLFHEAISRFNIKPSREGWDFAVTNYTGFPPYAALQTAAAVKNDHLILTSVKAALLYEMVKDTCNHGVYRDMGRNYFLFQSSRFYVIDIDGYQGESKALNEYLESMVDAQGTFVTGSITQLTTWLKKYAPTVTVTVNEQPGMVIASNFRFPVVGSLTQIDAQHYRFLAYSQKATEPIDAQQKRNNEIVYRHYANLLVSAKYAPQFRSLLPEWQPDISAMDVIELPADKELCADINIPSFVKKDYSDEIFADFEGNRSLIQSATVSAARITAERKLSATQSLVKQIEVFRSNAKTKPVQDIYSGLLLDISSSVVK